MLIELTPEEHQNLLQFWNRVPATGPECLVWVQLAQKLSIPVDSKYEEKKNESGKDY